jgi:hypothetical protein
MRGRCSAEGQSLEAIVPNQTQDIDVEAVARALTEAAVGDSQLRSGLESWQARVQFHVDGDMSNSVTGEIHGKVVQARDIGSLQIE